jgi:hypothetical protein
LGRATRAWDRRFGSAGARAVELAVWIARRAAGSFQGRSTAVGLQPSAFLETRSAGADAG